MQQGRVYKTIAVMLLISIALSTKTLLEVKALPAFTATIYPAEVNANQVITFSAMLTNTGDRSLGSATVTIPVGFSSFEILTTPSGWSFYPLYGAVNLTADSQNAVIIPGGSLAFTFTAFSPASPGVYVWNVTAYQTRSWGNPFPESSQPAVNVTQNQYSLATNVVGSGSVTRSPDLASYDSGVVVTLTAVPVAGWSFSGWSGDLSGSANPTTITMDAVKTVTAIFAQNQYSLATSVVGSGSIARDNNGPYRYGDVVQLTAVPSPEWRFGGWTGSLNGSFNPSSIIIVEDSAVTAVFVVNQYTISASAGEGGSINPEGITVVDQGGSQYFAIIPNVGYNISSVLVNGTNIGSVSSYTLSNVTGDTTITASFVLNAIKITSSAGPNGSISPSGDVVVSYGNNQQFVVIADTGYHIADLMIDGMSVGVMNSYTFTNVTTLHSISVIFEIDSYTISVFAGPGGTVTPAGAVMVNWKAPQSFTITPDAGYYVSEVKVDGVAVGSVTFYNFTEVITNHNITASFAATGNSYLIDVASSHGSPTAPKQVNAGGSFTASVTSPEGDATHRWICTGYSIDGGAAVSGTSCSLTNIQTNHTITFSWQEQYYLTVNTLVGTAAGSGWYNKGAATTVSISGSTVENDSGTRAIFIGWTGDAAGPEATSNLILIDGAKTATANWRIQYQVTYSTSGNGLQVAIPPTEWVDSGAPAMGTFPSSLTNSAGNTRVTLVGDRRPATITRPVAIRGEYQTQYLVTFCQSGVTYKGLGTIVTILDQAIPYEKLDSAIWVNKGGSVTFSYTENVESADFGDNFVLLGANATSPLTISEPTTIQGDYELQTSFSLNTILLSVAVISIPPLVVIPVLATRRRTKRITPIAIGGGSISPSTPQKIERGGSSTVFIIAANPGYKIGDVIIDKAIHLGPVRTYKFLKVNENHTISAIFYED